LDQTSKRPEKDIEYQVFYLEYTYQLLVLSPVMMGSYKWHKKEMEQQISFYQATFKVQDT
jgi:hypothetical protein